MSEKTYKTQTLTEEYKRQKNHSQKSIKDKETRNGKD